MCKTGAAVPAEISPGIQVPSATANSTAISTLVQDSIQNYIDVSITGGAALLIGLIILTAAIIVVHKLSKFSHRVTHQRLHTLADLTGHGAKHLDKTPA